MLSNLFQGFSHCDQPPAMTDFDGQKYMGMWFQQVHTTHLVFDPATVTCSQQELSELQPDGTFRVENSSQGLQFGTRGASVGSCQCPDPTGQCYLEFGPNKTSEPNYIIVDTDYDSYSVVYSCGAYKAKIYLITREAVVSEDLIQDMYEIVQAKLPKYDLSPENNYQEYQGDKCTYATYPSDQFFLQ